MIDEKWKTKPLQIDEVFAAADKGIDMKTLEQIRNRFKSWADFVTFLGKLPNKTKGETMYLFFDTETTGLPNNWSAPLTDGDAWPRLIQLAWIATDKEGNKIAGASHIIKPVGFEIPEEASRIHGITTKIATSIGESLPMVLNVLHHQISACQVVIGHNIDFDCSIIGAEFIREGLPAIRPVKPRFCTMKSSTDLCKIPGPRGYKWPKLIELHRHLFGVDFEGAHNALADIEATAKCFWELRRRKQKDLLTDILK
jgi:DNA polymerase III subunit epsilon